MPWSILKAGVTHAPTAVSSKRCLHVLVARFCAASTVCSILRIGEETRHKITTKQTLTAKGEMRMQLVGAPTVLTAAVVARTPLHVVASLGAGNLATVRWRGRATAAPAGE